MPQGERIITTRTNEDGEIAIVIDDTISWLTRQEALKLVKIVGAALTDNLEVEEQEKEN